MGGSCCRRLSRCRCLTPRRGSVSSRRSPNPTCGFPALGSPVGSCASHTSILPIRPAVARKTDRECMLGDGTTPAYRTVSFRTCHQACLRLDGTGPFDGCGPSSGSGPSLMHAMPSGIPGQIRGDRHATPKTLLPFSIPPHLRPLPSAGITPLHQYYGPLRHPDRPGLSLAGFRLVRATPPTGLPVLRPSPSSMRAAATTPVEPDGARVARFPRGWQPSPIGRRVGFHIGVGCGKGRNDTPSEKSMFGLKLIRFSGRFMSWVSCSFLVLPLEVHG